MCTRRVHVHVHVHINSIILFSTPVFSPRQRHLFAFRFINQLAKTKNGEGGSFASLENWQKKHNHAFVHTYIFRVGKDRPSDCGLLDAKKKLTVPKGAPEGILSARYRYHRYYISTKDLRESTASSGEKKERKKKTTWRAKPTVGLTWQIFYLQTNDLETVSPILELSMETTKQNKTRANLAVPFQLTTQLTFHALIRSRLPS